MYKNVFQFFWHHIRPYRVHYAFMMQAPIISGFYLFANTYAIKLFLDTMVEIKNPTYADFYTPIVIYLGSNVLLDVVWRISNYAELRSEPYVRRNILGDAYDYVQHHSFRWFQNNFTASIGSKLKGILDGYDKLFEELHHGLFPRLMKIVIFSGALVIVNQTLVLFIVGWGVLYFIIMYRMSVRLNTLVFKETESRHELVGMIGDKVSNIFTLMSFTARKSEAKALNKKMDEDFVPRQLDAYWWDFRIQVTGGLLYWFKFGALLFFMIHLRMEGQITVGDFAFVFGLTMPLAEEIWRATLSLQDFARAMGDLKSAFSIMTVPHTDQDAPHAKPFIMGEPRISFKNVSFQYDVQNSVLKDFSLEIQPGEKIGVVGHSGAGKSTLVNLLMRYFPVNRGSIEISGQDISLVQAESLREKIGIIPQDTLLFHRSLLDNVWIGRPSASLEEVHEACRKAHLHDFVITLPEQYETMVGERGVKLSGGQRQRVAIARAFLKNAPILILDEATSALDSQTESQIQESLATLMADEYKTVIAIAHRLSTLKNMDRILVLEKGHLIQQGTHEQLLAESGMTYRQLWDHQVMKTPEEK